MSNRSNKVESASHYERMVSNLQGFSFDISGGCSSDGAQIFRAGLPQNV